MSIKFKYLTVKLYKGWWRFAKGKISKNQWPCTNLAFSKILNPKKYIQKISLKREVSVKDSIDLPSPIFLKSYILHLTWKEKCNVLLNIEGKPAQKNHNLTPEANLYFQFQLQMNFRIKQCISYLHILQKLTKYDSVFNSSLVKWNKVQQKKKKQDKKVAIKKAISN